MKNQCYGIAPLERIYLRDDHRRKERVFVCEMAHVRVIDITTYEPAHSATSDYIRSEVLLCRDARRTYNCGQTIRSYANNFLALVLVIQQRGD